MIQLHDKQFELFIPKTDIQAAVERMAVEMEADLQYKNPLFITVLNGAFIFAADLMRALTFDAPIHFIKTQSYIGTTSSGLVNLVLDLNEDITDRTVVIIEDIVDTGHTLKKLLQILYGKGAASVKIASFLQKPDALQHPELEVDYVGISIPNKFVVGYGLDYDGLGRSFRDIYQLKEDS